MLTKRIVLLLLLALFFILFVFKFLSVDWNEVKGYKQAVEECKNLCDEYKFSGCSQESTQIFCFSSFEIDLNRDEKIEEDKFGKTPLGLQACESRVFCSFLLKECNCNGKVLNFDNCIKIKCNLLKEYGMGLTEANENVNNLLYATCGLPKRNLCPKD